MFKGFDQTEMDFEKIRHYPSDELTVDQMDVIALNKDKLSTEEKEAFSHFVDDDEFVANVDNDNALDTPSDNNDNIKDDKDTLAGDDKGTPDNPSAGGEKVAINDGDMPSFKTRKELDEYIAKKVAEANPKKDEPTPQDKKPRQFDPNWKAKNPEELYTAFKTRLDEESAEAAAEREKRQQETDKRLDSELDELAGSGLIPSKNTDEGKKAISQMAAIAQKYGFNSFKPAYDLWSQIPESKGGGLKLDMPTNTQNNNDDEKRNKLNKQKERASKVSGGGRGDGASKPTKIPYDKLRSMSMDDVVEHGLNQYGIRR